MKYKIITSTGPAEIWDSTTALTIMGQQVAIRAESGVLIPWHEVRRLVPVTEKAPTYNPGYYGASFPPHSFRPSDNADKFTMDLCDLCGGPGKEHPATRDDARVERVKRLTGRYRDVEKRLP